MLECPNCSTKFNLVPINKRLESKEAATPKPMFSTAAAKPRPSLSTIRKMAAEIDCPNCKSSLKQVYRFDRLSYLLATLVVLGFFAEDSYVTIQFWGPILRVLKWAFLALLIGTTVWEGMYPRLELRNPPEPPVSNP